VGQALFQPAPPSFCAGLFLVTTFIGYCIAYVIAGRGVYIFIEGVDSTLLVITFVALTASFSLTRLISIWIARLASNTAIGNTAIYGLLLSTTYAIFINWVPITDLIKSQASLLTLAFRVGATYPQLRAM
jgi:hypothetical protein